MNKVYRWIVDHLTKVLGALGASLMSVIAFIDPAVVREAAQTYLGDKWVAKLGVVLFILVMARGYYTGRKAQQAAGLPPPDPNAARTIDAGKVMMIALCVALAVSCSIAIAAEVPIEKDAPQIDGHPLTSVVVTQCGLVVAAYLTMSDGRLLRFDKSSAIPVNQLMDMAYSATRSERVEVSCNDTGAVGYEKHEPI